MADQQALATGRHLIGVDIGGTFTDLVTFEPASGRIAYAKARSTPRELSAGIADCVAKSGLALTAVDTLFHGSTVVINALIERSGAKTALVTTRGFRDVLEIGRSNRPENYNLFYRSPPPFVPRHLRFEVTERVAADGSIVTPLDAADIASIVEAVRHEGIEAIAICFLHAYANAEHEQAAARLLATALPDLYICTSNETACEWREFERTSTTTLNAFVGPRVSRYVEQLEQSMGAAGFTGRLYLMRSNGGVMAARHGKRLPVAMVESGPVAGMIGAGQLAAAMGEHRVVGFDMGGTTAKAALIEQGEPRLVDVYYVNGYANGYPLQVPTIEVIEVGTGGGSMAWLDATGALKVGPRSAGSEPGPACVGAGGTEPTVTDANAVLGRLNAAHYLGGEIRLDIEAAARAIDSRIAQPLGLSIEQAAAGIVTIANSNMALAVRGITIEKGIDPRDTALVAFGGGGPLHAAAIARDIGIPRVIVPPMPACFSALGMLLADLRHDLVRTCAQPLDGRFERIDALLAQLSAEGAALLTEAGATPEALSCSGFLDLCYAGQHWTLPVPVGTHDEGVAESTKIEAATATTSSVRATSAVSAPATTPAIRDCNALQLRERFDRLYEERFGHAFPGLPLRIINVRVRALGRRPKPQLPQLAARVGAPPAYASRDVYVGAAGRVPCRIYRREALAAGDHITGPALIEEDVATLLLDAGDTALVRSDGSIVVQVAPLAVVSP